VLLQLLILLIPLIWREEVEIRSKLLHSYLWYNRALVGAFGSCVQYLFTFDKNVYSSSFFVASPRHNYGNNFFIHQLLVKVKSYRYRYCYTIYYIIL
jgi:hypothetical protein